MQQETKELLYTKSSLRVLDGTTFLLHYTHTKAGAKSEAKRCSFCQSGIDSVIKDGQGALQQRLLRESARANEEQAATLPPDDGWTG